MTDVFRDLPRLSWRGIEVPVAERRVGFDQELARHKFAYRDDELVESLGRRNWRFDYTIPFRQDVSKGPYRDLFITTYPEFLTACRDRSTGDLVDPVLGTFQVRCEQVTTSSDVNKRDGDDLQVTFVHSPAVDDIDQFGAPLAGLETMTQQGLTLNSQIIAMNKPFVPPDLMPELDLFDSINAIGSQLNAFSDRLEGKLDQFANKLDSVTNTLEGLDERFGDPVNAPIIRSARRLHDSVNRAKNQFFFGRTVATQVVGQDTTVGPLTQFLKNTVAEFVMLNPGITLPLVLAGTTVSYFRK